MPIRFACPHCQQRLSVPQQKAGSLAECPRCKRTLTIPQPPDAPASDTESTRDEQQVLDHPPAPPKAARSARDVITIPRYVVYLQGMLLAVVALLAFALGILMGTTLHAPSPPAAQGAVVTGSVMRNIGPRRLADAAAVVILLPQTSSRAAEKTSVRGLRPGDPPPEEDHRGLAVLRQSGGAYRRTDANGRFQVEVASRGRYLLLVISGETRRRSAGEPARADLLKLSRYFDDPATLLGDRQYRLTDEMIRGDRQFTVELGD